MKELYICLPRLRPIPAELKAMSRLFFPLCGIMKTVKKYEDEGNKDDETNE